MLHYYMTEPGLVTGDSLRRNEGLGLIPDWQFEPQPPPHGTGKYSEVTVDLPGSYVSQGISGAMFGDHQTSPFGIFWGIASIASSGLGAYHGYKRNHSVGWAIGWGILGALFPIITPAVAFAQGFGKEK